MKHLHDVKSYQFIGNTRRPRNINLKGELLLNRLQNIPSHKHILLDFDDTLFLKNSTELFISQVTSIYFYSIILQIFDLLKPWKIGLKKGEDISLKRDIFRLKFVLLFAPWSKKQWAKNAPKIARDHINYPLMHRLLATKNPIYITTFGYDFIINPLITSLDLNWSMPVFSTTKNILENRTLGKAKIIERKLGNDIWDKSICITDSALDSDILQKCSEAYLLKWSNDHIRAGLSPMLPFVYTKKVKRPTEKYFTRAIIGHDYLTLVAVFALYSAHPFFTMLALFFFLMAYFSVYEIGYYENDRIGLLYEEKPKVSKEFHKYAHHFRSWHAWMFGVIFTMIASYITVHYQLTWLLETETFQEISHHNRIEQTLIVFASFISLLITVRLVFYWFNHTNETGRIIPMFILQIARTASYLIVFATNIVGTLFLFTHAVSKWIPYSVYRFGGVRAMVPNHLINFTLLVTLLLILYAIHDYEFDTLMEPVSLVVIFYSMLRAMKDAHKFKEYFSFVKKQQPLQTTKK